MNANSRKHYGRSTTSTTTTPPLKMVPSGFPRYQKQMFVGFIAMTALYYVSIAWFDTIRQATQLPPSAKDYCPLKQNEHDDSNNVPPCWRADLFAFEVVSGLVLIWCGFKGFYAWHVKRIKKSVLSTPEGRLFGYVEDGDVLTAVSTTFQVFDLAVSLLIPEQRQLLFLCHHIMAATVSWYGLNNQYFHYYGVFYLGCSEISTIPLLAIDLAKFFPPEPGSTYDFVVGAICGPVFAITFTYYRVILWWSVGYQMFRDILHVINNGSANKFRPGRNHVLYVMIALNLLLGALQLFWFSIIISEARDFLGIGSENVVKSVENANGQAL